MLELLGGTFVLLFGVAVLLGIGLLIVQTIVYVTPAFRGVRFADRDIRRQTPIRLRWFGMAGGRRVRLRARQRRAGLRANYVRVVGIGALIVLVPLAGLAVATYILSTSEGAGRNPWIEMALVFGSPAASVYAVLKLSRSFRLLLRERRRLRAATAADARATDSRAPIVLLRAFRGDGQQVALLDEKALPVTLEEALVDRLARHGPVIAVGSPGEPLPPLGASREYVSGDWQQRVAQLIDEAAVIVVLLDRTPGLLWEIEQVATRRREDRLVIIVPGESATELEDRWRAVRHIIHRCRPEVGIDGESVAFSDTLAFVFDSGYRPHRIVGRDRSRPYYRDAAEHAMWFLTRRLDGRAGRSDPPRERTSNPASHVRARNRAHGSACDMHPEQVPWCA